MKLAAEVYLSMYTLQYQPIFSFTLLHVQGSEYVHSTVHDRICRNLYGH